MKNFRIIAFLILSFSVFLSAANAQIKKTKKVRKTKSRITKTTKKTTPKPPIDVAAVNYKILVEGSQSKVETPFIFVAQDAETYALIRSLVEGLPESSTIDFSKSAIVAAFAGEKNTGGFSVKIQQATDKIMVDVDSPPKGSMTAQMITYPFQVVSIPLIDGQPLIIEANGIWMSRIQNYQVTKGEFEYTGGFAGKSKKFNAGGTIGVLTFGDYSTYFFNLSGKVSDSNRKLSAIASGVKKEATLEIARLEAGTFAEIPHPPVKVTGTRDNKKLTLNFESLPPNVADGYMLRGKLEAVKK